MKKIIIPKHYPYTSVFPSTQSVQLVDVPEHVRQEEEQSFILKKKKLIIFLKIIFIFYIKFFFFFAK
jgi:hypothetical protein